MNLKDVPNNARKKPLVWTPEAEKALEQLKDVMCSELVLILLQLDKPFIVTFDATDHGYGAVLEQLLDDQLRIVAYYSKCYTAAQRNYSTSEKELLSIVMAVENWKCYLYGKKFIVYSDHQPLAWLVNKRNPHQRLERWLEANICI